MYGKNILMDIVTPFLHVNHSLRGLIRWLATWQHAPWVSWNGGVSVIFVYDLQYPLHMRTMVFTGSQSKYLTETGILSVPQSACSGISVSGSGGIISMGGAVLFTDRTISTGGRVLVLGSCTANTKMRKVKVSPDQGEGLLAGNIPLCLWDRSSLLALQGSWLHSLYSHYWGEKWEHVTCISPSTSLPPSYPRPSPSLSSANAGTSVHAA